MGYLVFLKINFSDKLLVRHALGYQRDVDLYTGVSKGSLKSRGSDKSIDYSSTPTVATEDREKLIQRLSELLQQKDVPFFIAFFLLSPPFLLSICSPLFHSFQFFILPTTDDSRVEY